MSTKRKTIDPEEIGFSLSIKVRKHHGKEVVDDITVDEIYSHNYYDYGSNDELSEDVKCETMKIFTEEELNTLIIHEKNAIEFGYRSYDGETFRKTYSFSSDKVSVREFVDAIVDFEKIARSMGSVIDRHHIFFEGTEFEMEPTKAGVPCYTICWGS